MMMMMNGNDNEWWLWYWSGIMSRRMPMMTLIDKDEECESIQCLFVRGSPLFKTYWPRERAFKLMTMVRLTQGVSQRERTRRLETPSTPTPAQCHIINPHRSHFHTFMCTLSRSLSDFKKHQQGRCTISWFMSIGCTSWYLYLPRECLYRVDHADSK